MSGTSHSVSSSIHVANKPTGYAKPPLEERIPRQHYSPQFHVDNLSSAHVYVRLGEGDSWESIPDALLSDCAQLTKANSIEGRPSPPSHVTD